MPLLIVLAGLLVALVGAAAWKVLRSREPIFEGKPLTFWVYEANRGNGPEARHAEGVMRRAGTNAIPTLLKMLRKRESPLVRSLAALARKQHVITVRYVGADVRTFVAARPFLALGPEAKGAVPELIEIFDQNISPVSQADIAEIFAFIGPEARAAVPSLLRAVGNTNRIVHECAIHALACIHAQPERVVPLLEKCLSDPDWSVKRCAMSGLAAFGEEARPALPALVRLYEAQEDGSDKALAAQALMAIDRDAATEAGVK